MATLVGCDFILLVGGGGANNHQRVTALWWLYRYLRVFDSHSLYYRCFTVPLNSFSASASLFSAMLRSTFDPSHTPYCRRSGMLNTQPLGGQNVSGLDLGYNTHVPTLSAAHQSPTEPDYCLFYDKRSQPLRFSKLTKA